MEKSNNSSDLDKLFKELYGSGLALLYSQEQQRKKKIEDRLKKTGLGKELF